MKKKLILLGALALCIAMLAGGSLAYFTAEDTAENVITAGSIDIALLELSQRDGVLVPFEDVIGVMPGTQVSKIVQVENLGSGAAWIRVRVDLALQAAAEDASELDCSPILLDYNTEDWTLFEGYYYYNTPLMAGETTTALFTTVTFDPAMGNEYQNSTLQVDVLAQATQCANNGELPTEAAGWPSEGEEAPE